MTFKAKLRKIGNSIGIYIPRNVITNYKIGDVLEFNVITSEEPDKPILEEPKFEEPKKTYNAEMCPKHPGSRKGTCGCK